MYYRERERDHIYIYIYIYIYIMVASKGLISAFEEKSRSTKASILCMIINYIILLLYKCVCIIIMYEYHCKLYYLLVRYCVMICLFVLFVCLSYCDLFTKVSTLYAPTAPPTAPDPKRMGKNLRSAQVSAYDDRS